MKFKYLISMILLSGSVFGNDGSSILNDPTISKTVVESESQLTNGNFIPTEPNHLTVLKIDAERAYGYYCEQGTSCKYETNNYLILDNVKSNSATGSYVWETLPRVDGALYEGKNTGTVFANSGSHTNITGSLYYNLNSVSVIENIGSVFVNDSSASSVNGAFSYNTGYVDRTGNDSPTSLTYGSMIVENSTITTATGATSYVNANDETKNEVNYDIQLNKATITNLTGGLASSNSGNSFNKMYGGIIVDNSEVGTIVGSSSVIRDTFQYGGISGRVDVGTLIDISNSKVGDIYGNKILFSGTDETAYNIATSLSSVNLVNSEVDNVYGTYVSASENFQGIIGKNHVYLDNSQVTGSLYGAYSEKPLTDVDMFSNSLLHVRSGNINVETVGNFSKIYVDINDANKNDAIITTKEIDNNGELSNVYVDKINTKVSSGDTYTLVKVDSDQNIQDSVVASEKEVVHVSILKDAELSYFFDDNSLKARIDGILIDQQAVKPLLETRLAQIENINRSVDDVLIIQGKNEEQGTWTPLAQISGGKNKYKENIESNDYRLIVGSKYQILDNLFAGAVFEFGHSSFDEGSTKNYGIALFTKYTIDDFYVDAQTRFGRSKVDAQYNSHSNYFGAGLTAGYVYTINELYSLDSSLGYSFTKLNSDNAQYVDDSINFKSLNSSRLQLKEQVNYVASDIMTVRIAGIFEHEFDTDVKSSIDSYKNKHLNLKGSTGIFELGFDVQASDDIITKLNFRAYNGKRDGGSAQVQVLYNF